MDLKEIGCDGVDWIHLVHDRVHWRDLVKTEMNFLVQLKAGYFLTSCGLCPVEFVTLVSQASLLIGNQYSMHFLSALVVRGCIQKFPD
jgi:hypothetical protein